jgi:HD superfamily phosphohydrolase
VKKRGLSDILGRYGLSASDVNPAKEGFTMLERELPDLCADRIDYILQGAVRRGIMSQAEQNEVLDALLFDEKTAHWYLKNEKAARLIADASIELNSKIFAAAWARMLYIWTAKALSRLVELGEFTIEDVLYNKTDAEVWSAFFENKDAEVRALVNKLKFSWYNVTEVSSPDQADITFKNLRCRIVNPRVLTEEGWQRLTQIDSRFKERFDKETGRCRYQYAKVKQSTNS